MRIGLLHKRDQKAEYLELLPCNTYNTKDYCHRCANRQTCKHLERSSIRTEEGGEEE